MVEKDEALIMSWKNFRLEATERMSTMKEKKSDN